MNIYTNKWKKHIEEYIYTFILLTDTPDTPEYNENIYIEDYHILLDTLEDDDLYRKRRSERYKIEKQPSTLDADTLSLLNGFESDEVYKARLKKDNVKKPIIIDNTDVLELLATLD